jgi:antitoxin component YwqK of YwqJK toxin-antitoxin module
MVALCNGDPVDPACRARTVVEQSYDEEGRLDGPNRGWTETGQLVLEETFVHGVRIGRHRAWYPDGRPREDGTFAAGVAPIEGRPLVDPPAPSVLASEPPSPGRGGDAWVGDGRKNVPVGVWKAWGPDGSLRSERTFDEQGNPEGRFCEAGVCSEITAGTGAVVLPYGDGGALRFDLRDHALDGVFELREMAEGKLVVERHRDRRGKLEGASERWYGGKLTWRWTYQAGVLDGPSFEDIDNPEGREITRGRNCQGHKCGTWTTTVDHRMQNQEIYDAAA